MNWTKINYGIRDGWICHFNSDRNHYLRVGEYELVNNYYVHYCINGSLHINKPITASNMNEAKAKAVQMMQEYLKENANYWNALVSLVNAEVNNRN